MNKMIKLSAVLAFSTALAACSTFHKSHGPSTPYQQCNGIKQEMMFTRTSMGSNNLNQFQINQKLGALQEKFNKMNCNKVLGEKNKK